jgi:hypothetical protein
MSEYARVINETGDHLGKLLGRQPSTPADADKVTGLPDVRSHLPGPFGLRVG